MSDRCPTCGRKTPGWPSKYSAIRAERDRKSLLPLLDDIFTVGDVGRALWTVNRHWSENEGVVQRLERVGFAARIEPKYKGKKMIRQWRKAGGAGAGQEGGK